MLCSWWKFAGVSCCSTRSRRSHSVSLGQNVWWVSRILIWRKLTVQGPDVGGALYFYVEFRLWWDWSWNKSKFVIIGNVSINQMFSLACDWSKEVTWYNIPQLELGNIKWHFPNNISQFSKIHDRLFFHKLQDEKMKMKRNISSFLCTFQSYQIMLIASHLSRLFHLFLKGVRGMCTANRIHAPFKGFFCCINKLWSFWQWKR